MKKHRIQFVPPLKVLIHGAGLGASLKATRAAAIVCQVCLITFFTHCAFAGADVLTYHYDLAHTGQNTNEFVLTPGNVNSNQFGLLRVLPTDGEVLAEPLMATGVAVPGLGKHDVFYIETENDTAYAFDANTFQILWQTSVLGVRETAYPIDTCTIQPTLGVSATPVIDRNFGSNGAIFMEAMSQSQDGYALQRLYALDLATGAVLLTSPNIDASYPGTGDDSDGTNNYFYPEEYVERASLMLLNGVVYTFWSAHCNSRPATSWVIGYDEHTLQKVSAINLEPNSFWGSIWNSGAGPSADAAGNIYVATGNGGPGDDYAGDIPNYTSGFDANGFPLDADYGCSLVKLSTAGNTLVVADYFAPWNVIEDNINDWDLGSGSPLVLPDMADASGITRQLVVVAGKDENIYVADQNNMGKFTAGALSAPYQEMDGVFSGTNGAPPDAHGQTGGVWSAPAYFNGSVYFSPLRSPVMAFPIQDALLTAPSSSSPTVFGYPGSQLGISASGTSNGIVWAVETVGKGEFEGIPTRSAILHAYDATDLGHELYNSAQSTDQDNFGDVTDFVTPMIANGQVYVASSYGVAVFGLVNPAATPIQRWRYAWFGSFTNDGAAANNASAAGDGVPNLVKYALGLNPFIPVNASQLVSAGFQQAGGNQYLTLNITRVGNPPDVAMVPMLSTNFSTWTNASFNTTVTTNGVQVTILDTTPAGAGSQQFMELNFIPASNN